MGRLICTAAVCCLVAVGAAHAQPGLPTPVAMSPGAGPASIATGQPGQPNVNPMPVELPQAPPNDSQTQPLIGQPGFLEPPVPTPAAGCQCHTGAFCDACAAAWFPRRYARIDAMFLWIASPD